MKNNRKGFTLLELLAVIIILAVIALITTPIVLNVVDEAKKSAFQDSTYGLIDAIEYKSLENVINGNSRVSTYTFPSTDIKVQGSQPTGGSASVNKDGKVQIAVHNGKWCATKDFDEEKITIKDYVEGECKEPEATETSYQEGTLLKINLGSGNTGYFYVLEDNGDTVKLIMDRNLGDNIAWGNEGDQTPTIASTQLSGLGWTNVIGEVRLPSALEIISQTKWYQSLTDEQKLDWENEYDTHRNTVFLSGYISGSTNADVRLSVSRYEADNGLSEKSVLLPTWLDINLATTGDDRLSGDTPIFGYWTNNLNSANPSYVWLVDCGDLVYYHDVGYSDCGVRPVITINKSYILEELEEPIYVNDSVNDSENDSVNDR